MAEEHEASAARAVAEERRRIAREMHDVVAHSVSVMVVQAGGARRILDRDPQRALEAAARIERTGREALGEMRHLLGVLHAGDEAAALAPQPTLAELDALVERAARRRAAGGAARGRRARPLPAGIDLAAYRIVQEALTNALKHAGGPHRGDRALGAATSWRSRSATAGGAEAARRERRPRPRRHARARAPLRRRARAGPRPGGGSRSWHASRSNARETALAAAPRGPGAA